MYLYGGRGQRLRFFKIFIFSLFLPSHFDLSLQTLALFPLRPPLLPAVDRIIKEKESSYVN